MSLNDILRQAANKQNNREDSSQVKLDDLIANLDAKADELAKAKLKPNEDASDNEAVNDSSQESDTV